MDDFRGQPSRWLKRNSNGFPDFLFTILTYSMILLGIVCLFWVIFGILAILYAGTEKAKTILEVMNSMKTGLISLAGVVFGLTGSYTVRRFKKDESYEVRMVRKEREAATSNMTTVRNMEDI